MNKTIDLPWGIPLTEEPKHAWGFRAILRTNRFHPESGQHVDLVSDRMGWINEDPAAEYAIVRDIIPAIREKAKWTDPNSELIEFQVPSAGTNYNIMIRSCSGYLHGTVWVKKD